MMDEHVLRNIVGAAGSPATLASLACSCRLLRSLVAEERACAPAGQCISEAQQQLGIAFAPAAAARGAALLRGAFRRQFLLDLAAARAGGRCWDGRRQSWDLLSLPQQGRWLPDVALLASDHLSILMYDAQLQPLGALSFAERPACAPKPGQQPGGRAFWGTLATLLFKCRLRHGLLLLDPPLRRGAAGWAAPPGGRAGQASLGEAGSGQQAAGPDDVSLARQSLPRTCLLARCALLAGSVGGLVDDALVRQTADAMLHRNRDQQQQGPSRTPPGQPHAWALRFLDISGNQALSDGSLAALLQACPQLRVLRAAGSNAGAAALAALSGRALAEGPPAEAAQQATESSQLPRRSNQHAEPCKPAHSRHSLPSSSGGADAAAAALAGLHVAAPRSQPACLQLEALDLGGCRGCKGTALRRTLRHLPCLRDLRVSGGPLHSLLDPLLPLMDGGSSQASGSRAGSSSSSSRRSAGSAGSSAGDGGGGKTAALAASLGRLTRLEALDCPSVTSAQAVALLRACTSLRRLALSSQQLAGERFEQRPLPGGPPLPALAHLEVGWGTGSAFLAQLAGGSPHLVSLTTHLGASVSDWQLQAVADSCRHLAQLSLHGSNVSDEGVAAVLRHCSQLTCLRLSGCTGPFSDGLADAAFGARAAGSSAGAGAGAAGAAATGGAASGVAAGAAAAAAGAGAEPSQPPEGRPPAFRLQELHLSWGACQLSDAGLAALLRPERATLRCLALKGLSRLSDACWATIARHAATLRCLHMDCCGALPGAGKGRRGGGGGTAPLSAGAATEGLSGCSALLALSLRGSVAWEEEGAARLHAACPSLETLELS